MQDPEPKEDQPASAATQTPKQVERTGPRRFKLIGEEWQPLQREPASTE